MRASTHSAGRVGEASIEDAADNAQRAQAEATSDDRLEIEVGQQSGAWERKSRSRDTAGTAGTAAHLGGVSSRHQPGMRHTAFCLVCASPMALSKPAHTHTTPPQVDFHWVGEPNISFFVELVLAG